VSIHIGWDGLDNDTLHWTLEGRWTWEEALECARQTHDMIEASSLPVFTIVEHRHTVWLPGDFNNGLLSLLQFRHPHSQMVLIVTTNPLLTDLLYAFNMLTEPLPFRFQIMNNLLAARHWIADYRVSSYIRQTQPR